MLSCVLILGPLGGPHHYERPPVMVVYHHHPHTYHQQKQATTTTFLLRPRPEPSIPYHTTSGKDTASSALRRVPNGNKRLLTCHREAHRHHWSPGYITSYTHIERQTETYKEKKGQYQGNKMMTSVVDHGACCHIKSIHPFTTMRIIQTPLTFKPGNLPKKKWGEEDEEGKVAALVDHVRHWRNTA